MRAYMSTAKRMCNQCVWDVHTRRLYMCELYTRTNNISRGRVLSESFKGRGVWIGGKGLMQAIGVCMDEDTHGSAACEVQHIVDLFLDYSPCSISFARVLYARFSRLERTVQLRTTRQTRRSASLNAFRVCRRAIRASLTSRERKKSLVDKKKNKKNKTYDFGKTRAVSRK